LLLALLSEGCAFLQVREDVHTLQNSTVLVGVVSSPVSFPDMPVVVAAYAKKDIRRAIVHYTTRHKPGPCELMVPVGTHNIVAFGDKNRNLMYDKGEPAGQILSAEQVSVPAGGVAGDLDIVITEQHGKEIDFPVGAAVPPKVTPYLPTDIRNQRPWMQSRGTGRLSIFRLISQKICQGPCRLFICGLSAKTGLSAGPTSAPKIPGGNMVRFLPESMK
jgi:hypothetical protein